MYIKQKMVQTEVTASDDIKMLHITHTSLHEEHFALTVLVNINLNAQARPRLLKP